MAYNLRSCDAENEFRGSGSENDEDNCEKESKFNPESINFVEVKTEEAIGERDLGSRAPGRPTTNLRGENDFRGSGSENDDDNCEKESKFNPESINFVDMKTEEAIGERVLGSHAPGRPTTNLRGENDFRGSGSENDEDDSEKESKFNPESINFPEMETEEAIGERVLGSCAPGMPTTNLRGMNGYVWKTQQPQRHSVSNLQHDIRHGITGILKYEDFTPPEGRVYLEKRIRCKLCPPRKDRKTREQCSSCQRPMCDQHRAFTCVDCTRAD